MYLHPEDTIEIKTDNSFPSLRWMKHKNGYWYVSNNGNDTRWHCTYSEDEYYARLNYFNGQIGPELFMVNPEENEQ